MQSGPPGLAGGAGEEGFPAVAAAAMRRRQRGGGRRTPLARRPVSRNARPYYRMDIFLFVLIFFRLKHARAPVCAYGNM